MARKGGSKVAGATEEAASSATGLAAVWQWLRAQLPLVLMILAVLAARSSLADHYVVPSGSMEPTLVPGDRVVVSKVALGWRLPFIGLKVAEGEGVSRGDVVIFDSPRDGTRLIKRVVAVGGDRVDLEKGQLRINGEPLARPGRPDLERFGDREVRLNLKSGGGQDLHDRVPEGHVLVLGDNRGNSADGRVFGYVPEDDLYALALRIYWRSGEGLVWMPL